MGGGVSSAFCSARASGKSEHDAPVAGTADMMRLMDFDETNKVDNFAQEMFLRSPKVEGLNHILAGHHGREAFMKFLRTEYAEGNLWFFMAVDDMKKGHHPDDTEFAKDMQFLASTYLSPVSDTPVNVSDELRESLTQMISGEKMATKAEILDALVEAQDEAIKIMALGAFPRFLLSPIFTEWRKWERNTAKTMIEAQAESDVTAEGVMMSMEMKMSRELDKVLVSNSWLTGLLASIESLPVCVSITAASENMRGFPLIYVNAAFEATTGYDRCEIIGQNCRFLQVGKEEGHVAEKDSIARLTDALRDAKPVKVAITNFRKDGSPFRNLLAMKPIMDQHGKYAFVMGIQFDIGSKNATAKKMKMIDDLFRVLPDTVFTNPAILATGILVQ